MTWFYLAIGSALGFTGMNLVARVISIKSKNPRAMSIVYSLSGMLMAFVIFFVSGGFKRFSLPVGFTSWFYLSIAMLFYGLFDRLRFYASKYLEASHLTIVSNISLVVAVTIAFFLYSESLTTNKILGFLMILIALLLVSIDKIKKIKWRGIILAVLINVFLGIAWSLDKIGAIFFNTETYNILAWILPIFVVYFPYVKLSDVKKEFKINSWKIVLLTFFNVIAYYMNLKALTLADATRVIPIVQTSTLFTVIFGIFLLNEKEHIYRKILAGAIAVLGVFLLV